MPAQALNPSERGAQSRRGSLSSSRVRADSGQDYISGRHRGTYFTYTPRKSTNLILLSWINRCQLVFPPVFYLSYLTLSHLCPAFHSVPWGACRCKLPLKSWVQLCHSFLCFINISETDKKKNDWLKNDLMLWLLVCDAKSFGHFILKACLSTVIQTYSLG